MSDSMLQVVEQLMSKGKGILAADESVRSADLRLQGVGMQPTEENRRLYRELFLNTDGIELYLSGVILFEETVKQKCDTGISFVDLLIEKGIVPGIKVDEGTVSMPNFPDEVVTKGLDNLESRLKEFRSMGLRFAKWRSVIRIGDELPTYESIFANAYLTAQYAAYCQFADIVPIVEPEVLLDGNHDLAKAEEVTTGAVGEVFKMLNMFRVDLKTVILKTSMVVPGGASGQEVTAQHIAEATVRMLRNSVPEETGGVVFLSGGQTPQQATQNLNEIAKFEPLPWEIAFSFARAIQQEALEVWGGKQENILKAREAFLKRLELSCKADLAEL